MRNLRIASAARVDIQRTLEWSERQFGRQARLRYQALIEAALHDVQKDPERPGSLQQEALGQPDVRIWHLKYSRRTASKEYGTVSGPAHFFLYRVDNDYVMVGRLLHERMAIPSFPDEAR
ncbi:plasmid stabilization protein ParE [Ancrocorticia populi]|uniref:Plasmid stabilization protein ParE n=1 Tax=Ancrocorticia populi TaxID=2175228 RepID=A0A2V1K8V9_9ACTO|nr:plasmid stabilization protein ParE [Ancrocorticia populi]